MKPILVAVTVFGILVTAAPAPAQFFLDFQDLPLGAELRVPDPPWLTDGVTVDGVVFYWSDWTPQSGGFATVQNLGRAGGSGHEVWTNNINLDFDWGGGPLVSMDFLFGEYGGNLNIEINGDLRNFLDMGNIDGAVIGGVLVSVTDFTGGYYGRGTGRVDLTGTINSFYIGGQEFVIDNVHGVPEPAGAAMLGLAALLCLRPRRQPRPLRDGGVS